MVLSVWKILNFTCMKKIFVIVLNLSLFNSPSFNCFFFDNWFKHNLNASFYSRAICTYSIARLLNLSKLARITVIVCKFSLQLINAI